MKKMKKVFAALLAIAMMAPMALADEIPTSENATTVGVGTYANPANANVWEIEFPTAESASFTVDPLGLVKAADQYELGADHISDGTVLFPIYNEDGELTDLKNESDALKVVNKGTTAVTVDLNVRPTATSMTYRDGAIVVASDTETSIAFQAGEGATPTYGYVPAVGKNFTADIAKADAWKTEFDGENYVYVEDEEKTGADDFAWNNATFKLKGEANTNTNAKWDTEGLTAPNLKLTWNVRNQNIDAIAVVIPADLANRGTDYTIEADCLKAVAGQTVNVYVRPKDADSISPAGYVIDTAPAGIKTATMNYYTKEKTVLADAVADAVCKFGNGIASDNGTVVYSFKVPAAEGLAGFTAKDGAATPVDNTITISTAPTIKKLVISATAEAISAGG